MKRLVLRLNDTLAASTRRSVSLAGVLLVLAMPFGAVQATPGQDAAELGRRIYLEGIGADGAPVRATRSVAPGRAPSALEGKAAACVACHRPSGLGSVEGEVVIPPVSGKALFEPGGVQVLQDTRMRRSISRAHPPYSDASFADAVRLGRSVEGREMQGMMPRYALSDQETAALASYLRTLTVQWSPGITRTHIRLATIIAPDVDEASRDMVRRMVRDAVGRKNLGTRPNRRHMVGVHEFVLRSERHWEHEFWELKGAPDTWSEQLDAWQRSRPVFAIASGIARDWRPMHAFCEREKMPCWFPLATVLPESAETDRYGLYFDGGVDLEAQVVAREVTAGGKASGSVLQVIGADPLARVAAQRLNAVLGSAPTQILEASDPSLSARLSALGADDHLMLWLGGDELARVTGFAPPNARIYVSTRLGGSDQTLANGPWAPRSHLVYPYELPAQRRSNLTPLKVWLGTADIPYGDEALQSRVLFAISFLTESLADMLHNLHRDYLIERAETMLDRREYDLSTLDVITQRGLRRRLDDRNLGPSPMRAADGHLRVTYAELTSERSGSTVYPSLTLGIGQRIASKGAWLVPLEKTSLATVTADAARWIIPR